MFLVLPHPTINISIWPIPSARRWLAVVASSNLNIHLSIYRRDLLPLRNRTFSSHRCRLGVVHSSSLLPLWAKIITEKEIWVRVLSKQTLGRPVLEEAQPPSKHILPQISTANSAKRSSHPISLSATLNSASTSWITKRGVMVRQVCRTVLSRLWSWITAKWCVICWK